MTNNERKYPPRDAVSGDCPICGKYQSSGRIVWRGKVFCTKEHMRKYMHETLTEESLEEYDDLWQELADK